MNDPYVLAHEAALVGTGRAPTAEVLAAAERLLGPAELTAEARLLELAAATTRVRRATQQAVPAPDRPGTVAPPAQPVGEAVRQAFAEVLATAGLDELVASLQDLRGRALDPDALVAVLERATGSPQLRRHVPPVLGARGTWLAAQNPGWSWVGPPIDAQTAEELWPHAVLAERRELLAAVRRVDPERGLRLLAGTWDADRADDLTALLPELAHGLSPADEPALEGRLDDRRVQVRRAAAALLAQLPDSAYVDRAAARAGRWLQVQGRLRRHLVVTPPDGPDEEMARDAVDTTPLPGLGAAASLLAHAVGLVPPHRLRTLLGVDNDRLVALVRETDWAAGLLRALTVSGRRAADGDLLARLVGAVPVHELLGGVDDDRARATVLSAGLAPRQGVVPAAALHDAVGAVPGVWGPATSAVLWPAFLELLRRTDLGDRPHGTVGLAARVAVGLQVTPEPLPLSPDGWRTDAARQAAGLLLTTYTRRQRLHAALALPEENA